MLQQHGFGEKTTREPPYELFRVGRIFRLSLGKLTDAIAASFLALPLRSKVELPSDAAPGR